MFVTIVRAAVSADREADLLAAWAQETSSEIPPGLRESKLLKGDQGEWQIMTVWESREAVLAMRAQGRPPAAIVMFERAGARAEVAFWTVEGSLDAHADRSG
jgi:heme-degrading monooxygenase HmoA